MHGCWASELVADGEGNHLVPLIDLEIDRRLDWCSLTSPISMGHCGVIAEWARQSDIGSINTSCFTSPSMSSYTHPLGRVGRQYLLGIFIVFLDGTGQLINQCDSVCMCEVKSRQVGMDLGSFSGWPDQSSWGFEYR